MVRALQRHPSIPRLVNLSLRAATLGSKFLLIFFLARFLEPAELGLYGLLVVTVGYSLYLLGFDFYTYTTRELLKRESAEWGGLLKSQIALSALLYAVFLPLLLLIFAKELLPWSLAPWFFALLILEHLSQELGRLLVAISRPLTASLVLFFRSGMWAVVVTCLMFMESGSRRLEFVLAGWTIGSGMAVALGLHAIHKMHMGGWQSSVDWRWIKSGLKVAIPFLVATLAIRGIFTADRYWFESLTSLQVLGAYVLFMGFANALMAFLDAAVFSFSYPALISAHAKDNHAAFQQSVRKLLLHTLAITVGFSAAALALIDPILSWMGRPLYVEYQFLFPWILLGTILYAVGMVPHYALYAQGHDRPIIGSHVASLPVFAVATTVVSLKWPVLAVPLGLCAAFLAILVWKTWAYFSHTPAVFRTSPALPKTSL